MAVSIIGGIVALMFVALSALMNLSYGMSRGVGELDRWLLGGASVAADVYKACGLFFVGWALKHRRFLVWSLASAAWVICVVAGLASAFGYAALNRADATRRGDDRGAAHRSVKAELDRTERRRAMVGVVPSRGVLEARGLQLKASAVWRQTRECRDIRRPEQTNYCGDVRLWQQERAAAEEAERLDGEIGKLRSQLGQFLTTSVVGDPLGELLVRVTGLDLKLIDTWLVVLFVALVEIMSCAGFYVAFGHGEAMPRFWGSAMADDKGGAIGDVARFAVAATREAPGEMVNIDELYDGYREWCRIEQLSVLALTEFALRVQALAGEVGWMMEEGRVEGLRLS